LKIAHQKEIGEQPMQDLNIGWRLLPVLAVAYFLAACESGPKIVTNSAPGFSLAGYQTFGFLKPLGTDRGNVQTLTSATLIDAATFELQRAGLRQVDANPDLLVNFVISTRETLQTRSTPNTGASMHYGRGGYGTWGGYSMSMSTNEVVQRTEGTLGIDIIDAARLQLVWEGAATARITESMQQNRDQLIRNAVADILAKFP
jgi:hypothetical protein